jgi:hypothetical protein
MPNSKGGGGGTAKPRIHDRYRLIARKHAGRVRLFTRRGFDWTNRYQAITIYLKRRVKGCAATCIALDAPKRRYNEKCCAANEEAGGEITRRRICKPSDGEMARLSRGWSAGFRGCAGYGGSGEYRHRGPNDV